MKTTITLILMMFCLVGCSEISPYKDGFVINEIRSYEKNVVLYSAIPIRGAGKVFFYESNGLFNVGDTIWFALKNPKPHEGGYTTYNDSITSYYISIP